MIPVDTNVKINLEET